MNRMIKIAVLRLFFTCMIFLPVGVGAIVSLSEEGNAKKPYFAEILEENDPWQQTLEISKELYRGKSDLQEILVFENRNFGRVLAIDNIIQTTEADEAFYHEMIVHVPLLAHGKAQRVLVIGGGDGGAIREVLRHPEVKSVTMVEIDGKVVELCKEYLPSLSQGAFKDPRVQLLIQDGVQFVKNTHEKFDVIICDSTDPVGPGKALFTREFYKNCKNILNKDGVLVTQNGVPFDDAGEHAEVFKNLHAYFEETKLFLTSVPTYTGGFISFSWATDNPGYSTISLKKLQHRLDHLKGKMKYYTPEIHKASFALPQYVKDMIDPKNRETK